MFSPFRRVVKSGLLVVRRLTAVVEDVIKGSEMPRRVRMQSLHDLVSNAAHLAKTMINSTNVIE